MSRLSSFVLQSIIKGIPAGVVVVGKDRTIVYANVRAGQLLGVNLQDRKLSEYTGAGLQLLTIDGKNYAVDDIPATVALRTGKEDRAEMVVKRPDGSRIVVSTSAQPIIDENGFVTASVSIFEDITAQKKADEELKKSEERLRLIIDNSMDAILLTIPNGTILSANFAAQRMFRMTEDEIRSAGRDGLVINDERHIKALAERTATGKMHAELTYKRKDGSMFEGEVTSNYFTDIDGITKTTMIIRDITERKKIEGILRENQERLELAQRVARLGSWEVFVKEDRAVWSDEMFNIFGLKRKTAPNTKAYSELIHPDDLKMVTTTMQALIAHGKMSEKTSFDYRIVRPDNEVCYIHSERMIRDVDTNGKAIRIVGIEQDITERKKTEEALRKSEERFRLVAEAAKVMVYEVLFGTDTVRVFSGEDVLGYSKGEMNGSNAWWFSQIDNDDVQRIEAENKLGIASGHEYMLEYRVRRKQGDYVCVHDTVRVVRDDQGKVVRLIGGLRDITSRKQSEEALLRSKEQLEQKTAEVEKYATSMEKLAEERAQKLRDSERLAAIGATAGMVGHDIRNPLQAISSDVYLLKDSLASMPQTETKDEVKESLDGIEKNVEYINKIVADLQDYARQLKPEYKWFNLTETVQETLKAVDIPDNVKVTNNIAYIELRTDPQFIRRALNNLFNNAIQAMPTGGNLAVEAHEVCKNKNERKVVITVTDTGVGIPDDVKPRLFTPMMTTKSKGQGLGLAVVKRLVEALGGTIAFESVEGKGTKFIIELPMVLS